MDIVHGKGVGIIRKYFHGERDGAETWTGGVLRMLARGKANTHAGLTFSPGW